MESEVETLGEEERERDTELFFFFFDGERDTDLIVYCYNRLFYQKKVITDSRQFPLNAQSGSRQSRGVNSG